MSSLTDPRAYQYQFGVRSSCIDVALFSARLWTVLGDTNQVARRCESLRANWIVPARFQQSDRQEILQGSDRHVAAALNAQQRIVGQDDSEWRQRQHVRQCPRLRS